MRRTLRSLVEVGLGAYVAVMLIACSFKSPGSLDTPADLYEILNTAPYAEPYAAERWTVVDDTEPPGLRVEHGFSCVHAERAASKNYLGIRLQEHVHLPASYTGTVFMNGWSAEYDSKDHHVTGLGSIVFNIRELDGTLFWEAGGVLSDKKGDDAYDWCYDYTLVSWPTNSNKFDIRATHSDSTGKLLFVQDEPQVIAVHTIPGSFTSPDNKVPRAALPSGFAIGWRSSDHHLAQIGFELGAQSIAQKTLSWTSKTVFKDNARRRPYYAAEAVTVLRGRGIKVTEPSNVFELENDVYVLEPNGLDFTPLPKTSCPGVQLGGPTTKLRTFMITGLTSDYAVPMLTGFELAFSCDDQHVTRVGAKIRDFAYEPPRNGSPGTLHVQVETMLTDKDKIPEMRDRVELSVLGIDKLGS